MSQRNWQVSKTYCRGCRSWRNNATHKNCPRGAKGSLIWLDIANFEEGCNKCNEVWPLENSVLYCSCGNVQHTQYVDTTIAMQAGDQIIATDGDLVYVLTRTGTVVVGSRRYLDVGY